MASYTESEKSDSPEEKTTTGWHKYWTKEIDAAEKRLAPFKRQGSEVNQKFLDKRTGEPSTDDSMGQKRLNLYHTNVSTLQSMLCGSTPKIDVSREHNDPGDDVARVASVMYKRILEANTDPSGEDTQSVLKQVLQDRLLPGFGVGRVRYEFTVRQEEYLDENEQPQTREVVDTETAIAEYVHWRDCLWGWGRTWKELPWWGFRSYMSEEECKERFDEDLVKDLTYEAQTPTDNKDGENPDEKSNIDKAEIWEFWNKKDKTVFWWSKGASKILDMKKDPLKLEGFLPIPKPLAANITTTLYEPRSDFVIAQDIYSEIDELYTRITIITRAVKVVGVFDKAAESSVGRMLKEGNENELIPVDNWAMFAEAGGLKGKIDWFPVQEVVETLSTLRQLLGEQIQMLYEVTGMSDILRGASTDQYTSDGTNQLKAKFGSIRVQALQDEFARFASDLQALKAEVISKHFAPQTILRQSSAQFLPEPDKLRAEPAVQLMKSTEIKWRVDIRPESIAMVDYAQLKSERTEFLTSMATFIQGAVSMTKIIPESMPMLLEMLKWGMAGFKGSDYLEGIMDAAIEKLEKAPPQQEGQNGAQEGQLKIQLEQMKGQIAAQKAKDEKEKILMKSQADQSLERLKLQNEIARMQADTKADMTIERESHMNELRKMEADLTNNLTEIAAKLEASMKVEEAQSMFAIAEEEVQHANTMTELGAKSDSTTADE